MSLNKIRKTIETPPRVSVIDLIAAVSKAVNPREAGLVEPSKVPKLSARLTTSLRAGNSRDKGRDELLSSMLEGRFMIDNLLPGSMAASFHAAWADIIVR